MHVHVFLLPLPNRHAGTRKRKKKTTPKSCVHDNGDGILRAYCVCVSGTREHWGREVLHKIANSKPYDYGLVCTNQVTALRVRGYTGYVLLLYCTHRVSPLVSIPNSAATSQYGPTKANNKNKSTSFDPRLATMYTRYYRQYATAVGLHIEMPKNVWEKSDSSKNTNF